MAARQFVNQMEKRELLKTIHGSHLYGLAHENSDRDSLMVFLPAEDDQRADSHLVKSYAYQSVDAEGNDVMELHLWRFQQMVAQGAPQALEALFSPLAETDEQYAPLFRQMRPSIDAARSTYRRASRNFAEGTSSSHGGKEDSRAQKQQFKLRRHSLRLMLNLNDLVRFQRFSPVLSEDQREFVSEHADQPQARFLDEFYAMQENAQRGRL